MKSLYILISTLLCASLSCASSRNRIKTLTVRDTQIIDRRDLSPEQLSKYDTFKSHCTSCHSEQRIVLALNSWAESDDAEYEERLNSTIQKKVRMANGSLSHHTAKEIHDFLMSVSKHISKPKQNTGQ